MAKKKAVSTDPVAAPATAPKPAAAKKPTGKKNVTQDMIAQRAYQLYVMRGRVDGFAEADWKQAERELRSAQ